MGVREGAALEPGRPACPFALAHTGCSRLLLGYTECLEVWPPESRCLAPRGWPRATHTERQGGETRSKTGGCSQQLLGLSRGPEKRLPRQSPPFEQRLRVRLTCRAWSPPPLISGLISAQGSVFMQSVGVLRSTASGLFPGVP